MKNTITITSGHGGDDPGAVYAGYTERELMTELRDLVAWNLNGHNVRTDGSRGVNLALAQALHLITGSAVAIELHTNAFFNDQASGVEVVALPKNKALAQRLAAAIADILKIPARGDGGFIDQTKTARGRIGFVARGGLVVEVFFLSNPKDRNAYLGKKHDVAKAIAGVIQTA